MYGKTLNKKKKRTVRILLKNGVSFYLSKWIFYEVYYSMRTKSFNSKKYIPTYSPTAQW